MAAQNLPKVLLSSFDCDPQGISEAYSGYKWVEQAAVENSVTLMTADPAQPPPGVEVVKPSSRWHPANSFASRLNGEAMLDYFYFNWAGKRLLGPRIREFDLVHYVGPMAPRYPCSIGVAAKRFIIGPLGGGLRVPESFRGEIEGREDLFYKLKVLDRWRLLYDPYLRRTFKAADMIVLNGRFMLDLLPEEFHYKCRFMLETGVDAADIECRRPGGRMNKGPLALLYVGRIVPYKGLLYILRALESLSMSEREAVRLDVIGDRDEEGYEAECKRFVEERNLGKSVRFLGRMPKPEVLASYRTCDLFVFPSLSEAGGNAVLEALASGCPAVVVDRGGPGESVSGECGYKIAPQSPESLVRDLAELFRRLPGNRESLGEKGVVARRRVEEVYDWKRKGQVMNGWYREVTTNLGDRSGSEVEFEGKKPRK